jgi:hypothetical protein
VAEVCAPVNHDVLQNPRVHIRLADAREVLLTSPDRYDVIFSEPSNPFRAGVASLFTREYYRAALARLQPDGVFLQWVQAYEVDGATVRTIYATLAQVFPEVETWELGHNDLLLVASAKPLAHDATLLRTRMAEEPYRTALLRAWRAVDLEGVFAHFVATSELARGIAHQEGDAINTDDLNLVEFGFARSIGTETHFDLANVRALARLRHEDRPPLSGGDLDFARVDDAQLALLADAGAPPPTLPASIAQRHRAAALFAYARGDLRASAAEWNAQPLPASRPDELAMLAESLAESGDAQAPAAIEHLREQHPTEAQAVSARLALRQNRLPEAAQALADAFSRYRSDPWAWRALMSHALPLAEEISKRDPASGETLLRALAEPFAAMTIESKREAAMFAVARHLHSTTACGLALPIFEPHVPWRFEFLLWRRDCYQTLGDPHLTRALRDLDAFVRGQPAPFSVGLLPEESALTPHGTSATEN